MNEHAEQLAELETLNALIRKSTSEEEAITVVYRMFHLLLDIVQDYQSSTSQPSRRHDHTQRLMSAFELFYDSYCTVWEQRHHRAIKIWWSLTHAVLHTPSIDTSEFFYIFWYSLRWISFAPEKRDFSELDRLMPLFFDDELGPHFIEWYLDAPLSNPADLLEAARHWIHRPQMEWLEAQIKEHVESSNASPDQDDKTSDGMRE